MKNKMNSFAPTAGGMEMKNKAVQKIFSCRPHNKAASKVESKTSEAYVMGKSLVTEE